MLNTKKESYDFNLEKIIQGIKQKGGITSYNDFRIRYSKDKLNNETFQKVSNFLFELEKNIKEENLFGIDDPIKYIIHLRYVLKYTDSKLFEKIGKLSGFESQESFCNGLLGSIFGFEYKIEKKSDRIERESYTINDKIFGILDNEIKEEKGKIFNSRLYECISNKADKLIYLLSYLLCFSHTDTAKKIYELKENNVSFSSITVGLEKFIADMGYGSYFDFTDDTINQIIKKYNKGEIIEIKIDKKKNNLSYLDFLEFDGRNSYLTKSSFQLENYVKLIEKAKELQKPILFIVRNKYIKEALKKVNKSTDTGIIYIEIIEDVLKGVNTKQLTNGIISFFDIPNLGKNEKTERELIEYLQQDLVGTQLIYSNFSDKFKSNHGLKETVTNGVLIDDNGTNTKELNDSKEHGNLSIEEIESIELQEDEERYKTLITKFQEKNAKPYIGLANTYRNLDTIKNLIPKRKKIIIINSGNIGDFYSGGKKIDDYDLVLLDDNFIGYIDISKAKGAICFDYLSLDKTRKIAKQLIFNQSGTTKNLISSKQIIAWYNQDNPKANIFGKNLSLADLFPKDTKEDKRNKVETKEKISPFKLTYSMKNRLGLKIETDIKRLDNEILEENLKEKLKEIDTEKLFITPIKELRILFNGIPEFNEMIKRIKVNTKLLKRFHYIMIFKELGLLSKNDIGKLNNSFIALLGDYTKIREEDRKEILIGLYGKNYKDKLIVESKKLLKGYGIIDYYDLLFYTYKIECKPNSFLLKNFNSSNNKDINSLQENIRKLGILNLAVLELLDGVSPSIINTDDLEKLGKLIFGDSPSDEKFKENVKKEIDDNFPNIKDVQTNIIRNKTQEMPYFNLYCKINGVKLSTISHERFSDIISKLNNK